MKCQNCGFQNPDGVRFCGQCATEFSIKCPNCSSSNPANSRYCGNCASLLDQSSDDVSTSDRRKAVRDIANKIIDPNRHIEGERRNITVLFLDISSFTSAAEKLDPEEIYSIVDLYITELVEEVVRFGGHVDKFTGDGLIALFGAPIAHEDDPERALHASLSMHKVSEQLAKQSSNDVPFEMKVRIGVNTGTVVVGSIGSDTVMDDYTAMGDVVNVAARLEQNAEPGTTQVSKSTYDLTHTYFFFDDLGETRLRGRQETVKTFKLLGEKPYTSSNRGQRLSSGFIGRNQELDLLLNAGNRLITNQLGYFFMIEGEAGIGKSRIVDEFQKKIPSKKVAFLRGDIVSYGHTGSYEVFKNILRKLFSIENDDTQLESKNKITNYLKTLKTDLIHISQPYVEYLLSIPLSDENKKRFDLIEPDQLRQQTFLGIRSLLIAVSERSPVILFFDDFHFIDELSFELLLFILPSINLAPILLICAFRTSFVEVTKRLLDFSKARLADSLTHLILNPLTLGENNTFIHSLLNQSEIPDSIKDLVNTKSEGNPFFTEELLGVLIDQGIIQARNGGWFIPPRDSLSDIDMPLTLDGLIMARVDSMGPTARQILQCASVIGRRFSKTYLVHLAEKDDEIVVSVIHSIIERGLLNVVEDRQDVYEFRHVLTRDSVYNSLLFRHRKKLHGITAGLIESFDPVMSEDEPELLAYHYKRSTTPKKAISYFISAGHLARHKYAIHEAISYYDQVFEFQTEDNSLLNEIDINTYIGFGEVLAYAGDYDLAINKYLKGLELFTEQNAIDNQQTSDIQRKIGLVLERKGDFDSSLHWLDEGLLSLDISDTHDKEIQRARILSEKGWVTFRLGNQDSALDLLTTASKILEGTDYVTDLAATYNRLVGIFYNRGALREALYYGERSMQIRNEVGDIYGVLRSQINLGALNQALGDWDKAVNYLNNGLELCRKMGFQDGIIAANLNLPMILLWKGEFIKAKEHLFTALHVAESTLSTQKGAFALIELGEYEIYSLNYSEAISYLEKAVAISSDEGYREALAEASWRLAWAYIELDNLDAAQQQIERAFSSISSNESKDLIGSLLRIKGMLLRKQHKLTEAKEILEQSIQEFQSLGNFFEAGRSQVELGNVFSELFMTDSQDQNNYIQADEQYQSAIEIFDLFGAKPDYKKAKSFFEKLSSYKSQQKSLQELPIE